MVVANRRDQEPLDDDIVDQGIFYSYTKNADKSFDSVNKKVNIFLKKIREHKWLTPQGWEGISSQSIKQKEDMHYKEKQEQYKNDRIIFNQITKNISSGAGLNAFSSMVKKLKSEVYG